MSKVIADTLQGRAAGNEAPDCPKGLTATGVVTATSFSGCLLYTSPSPRDRTRSRMPSSA